MSANRNSNFFLELADYFQTQVDKLDLAWRTAKIYDNPTDKGNVRENSFYDFLKTHLPFRCVVTKGGFIFDSLGNKSKQIDIVVTNDQTLQFMESYDDKITRFNCVEGCYAVISVKSQLGKKDLFDSLDNLASVSIHKRIITNPFITNGPDLIRQIPQRIIFAYKGDSAETTLEHLKEYYESHKVGESGPDLIILNNQFYLSRAGVLGVQLKDGTFIRPFEYSIHRGSKYIGSVALYQLISRIQNASALSPHMQIDFSAYTDAIDTAIFEDLNKK